MGQRAISRSTWRKLAVVMALAWPTMLEQLMQTVVQYVDTAMVGQLGTNATAAVGGTGTIAWLVNGTISALATGFLAYISQACGAGEPERAKRASAQAVLSVLFVGTFFTALTLSLSSYVPAWMNIDREVQQLSAQYFFILYSPMLFRTASIIFGTVLRAAGDSKTPMLTGLLVNVVNIILNFLLIYPSRTILLGTYTLFLPGAGLGVIGAGIASAVAYVVGGIMIAVALFRHPILSPLGLRIKPDLNVLRPCLKVALPNALQRFATSSGYVVFAMMINSLGGVATAAHTIANTVESAFYIPGYGMQAAAATLAGNAWGARDRERITELTRLIIPVEVAMMVLSGGLLFAFAPQMMSIFNKDAAVIVLGATVLRMVALSEPFYGVTIILEGMMQGMGNTVKPLVLNISGMWGIRIVGTFLCIRFFEMGLISAWACMIAHNLMLFAVFVFFCVTGRLMPKDGHLTK
jgi:putative MATE family efflux protein